MNTFHPFCYPFGYETIKEDLSELKTNKLFANGNQQSREKEKSNPFLILDKFKYSKKILTSYANKFLKDVFNYHCKFRITTSWMTQLGFGEEVHYHNHKNSMWSAVFYFDEYTDRSCPLKFRNPIPDTIPYLIGDSKDNPMTKDCAIPPEKNLLVIFPSWIAHYSEPNAEQERKSLAFNLMPCERYGKSDSTFDAAWMR
tara:strand:+ start:1115 stop:1711 length:597 start_codon:yes stop_codon:yes gene_type:complete